jgi:hypothetical protein
MRMKWDTDRIVSVSAMFVGLGSLFIVLYQTNLMREQAKASVLPYLLIVFDTNNDGTYIALRNAGLGPALIDSIRVVRHGKTFDGDPYAYYRSIEHDKALRAYRDRVPPGMLVSAGQTLNMLGSTDPQSMYDELLRTFSFVAIGDDSDGGPADGESPPPDKAVLEIEYSSVYGEHWRVRSDRVVPEPL